MRALVIGTGAGGNKAVINLVNEGIIAPEDVVLVNSTLKDIPESFRNSSVILSNTQAGCGKERSIAKEITLEAIKEGKLNLKSLVEPQHSKCIIVSSLEGGTGSGSAVIIASYLKAVLDVNTEIIGFAGFEEDGRGLQNTIEFFQDLEDNYTIQVIRNSAFIKKANGNKLKAEELANKELMNRIRISLGQVIVDSTQNIDETDIHKLVNTVGYTTVEYKEIDEKIKSQEQFDEILIEMLNDTKSLESDEQSMARLGVIVNLPASSQDNIDYSFNPIKDKLGNPYEVFTHIEDTEELPRFIAFIASGMKMPKEEVNAIYDRYKKQSEKVNKNDDDFFSSVRGLKGNVDDGRFNMIKSASDIKKDNTQKAESDFFSKYSSPVKTNGSTNNSSKITVEKSEY